MRYKKCAMKGPLELDLQDEQVYPCRDIKGPTTAIKGQKVSGLSVQALFELFGNSDQLQPRDPLHF